MLKEEYLQDLSSEQQNFAAQFLADIFLHQKTNLSGYSAEEVGVICKIFKAADEPKMRRILIAFLAQNVVEQLLPFLSNIELAEAFMALDDLPFIRKVFQRLSYQPQMQILKHLQTQEPKRYQALAEFVSSVERQAPGLTIHTKAMSAADLEREAEEVLNVIQQPRFSFADAAMLARQTEKKYPIPVLEQLASLVLPKFLQLKLPVNNQLSFHGHLKFLYYLEPFMRRFPVLATRLRPLVDVHLIALAALPGGDWPAKVLNQLPIYMIQLLMTDLHVGAGSKNAQHQQVCLRLLTSLKDLDKEKFSNLYFALNPTK